MNLMRYPVVFCFIAVLYLLIAAVLAEFPRQIAGEAEAFQNLSSIFIRIALGVFLLLFILKKNIIPARYVSTFGDRKTWFVVCALVIYISAIYVLFIGKEQRLPISLSIKAYYTALTMLSVGFIEELVFRGAILGILLRIYGSTKGGVIQAIIISSVLFGVVHLLNVFAGKDLILTIFQVVMAFFAGIYYSYFMLKGKSIWMSVFFHGVVNVIVNMGIMGCECTETLQSAIYTLIFILPIPAVILILLNQTASTEKVTRWFSSNSSMGKWK